MSSVGISTLYKGVLKTTRPWNLTDTVLVYWGWSVSKRKSGIVAETFSSVGSSPGPLTVNTHSW